ncbi:MAG: superoxide dismutase [Bacteroidia bacterium]
MFTLPYLPYQFTDLEPHIDELTMQIHHDRHHKAYVDNLNKALSTMTFDKTPTIESLLQKVSTYPVAVRNNGGGHYNHSMFWQLMKANGGGTPAGKVADAINGSFGSFDDFKKKFNEAATTRFGSGWAWLIKQNDKLVIASTPNQDNPLMDIAEVKGTPVMGIDVWEHAYYLKYQNKRADYIAAWWNVINWDEVAKRLM